MSRRPQGRGELVLALVATLVALLSRATAVVAHDDPSAELAAVSLQIGAKPADAGLLLKRAELHRFRGEWVEGLADLQAAHRLAPELAAIDYALAELLLAAGDPGAALPAIDRFVGRHPDHSGAHRLRARILLRSGASLEAATSFTRAIELARSTASAGAAQPEDYLDRARALASAGEDRLADAIAGLDQGLAALGAPVTLALLAIELERRRGNVDEALRRIAVVEAQAKRRESWIAMRGDVLMDAGRRADAADAYRIALTDIEGLPSRIRDGRATTGLARDIRSKLSELDAAANDGAGFHAVAATPASTTRGTP